MSCSSVIFWHHSCNNVYVVTLSEIRNSRVENGNHYLTETTALYPLERILSVADSAGSWFLSFQKTISPAICSVPV